MTLNATLRPRSRPADGPRRTSAAGFLLALTVFAPEVIGCRSSEPAPAGQRPAASASGERTITAANATSSADASADASVRPADLEGEQHAARAERQFAISLYAGLRASGSLGQADAVLSPLSVAQGLAVAYDGARGVTRDEIGRALGSGTERGGASEALLALENKPRPFGVAPEAFRSSRLTAVWVAPPLRVKDAFGARAVQVLGAELFGGTTEPTFADAIGRINDWARSRSEGRIATLLAPSAVRADAHLIVVSALDVSGRWLSPFPKERTAPRPFLALSGARRSLPTMAADGYRAFASTDAYEAVQLPLEDKEHAVLVVAPRGQNFTKFESTLTPEGLDSIVQNLGREYITLELPKIDMTSRLSCVDALRAAGVHAAFQADQADFGEMLDSRVVLSQVLHAASFALDEHGVRGTAATFLVFPPPSLPPKPRLVRMDRPFFFALRNMRTGTLLFAGRFTGDGQ